MDPLTIILIVLALGLLVSIVLGLINVVMDTQAAVEAVRRWWRSRGPRSDDTGPGD